MGLSGATATLRPNDPAELGDAEQVNDEHEGRVRRDRRRAARLAVREVGRNDELAATADLHAVKALVPALDHGALAEGEREGLVALPGGVELLTALVEHADVVDRDLLAGGRGRACPLDQVLDD